MLAEIIFKGIPSVIVLIIAILLFFFWTKMLIDCLNRDFTKAKKILWFLVVAFLQTMGAFIYWLAIYKKT
jgi:hypothetical protein